MRLRLLLIAVVTMSVLPSIASARSRVRSLDKPHVVATGEALPYSIGAAVDPSRHLVIAFYNPDPIHAIDVPVRVVAGTIQYDRLTVELRRDSLSHTIRFVADREKSVVETARIQPQGLHFETIDLAPHTGTLPVGDYDVIVTWDGLVATAKLNVPYVCGFARVAALPKQDAPPSKLPFLLGGLAIASLFVALGLGKRAGTAGERVPCSPS